MDELAAFLRERLDEDERAAQRADEGPWRLKTLGRHDQAAVSTNATTGLIQLDGGRATANGVHIARHDPVRVLCEVRGKRMALEGAIRYAELVEAEYGWQRCEPEYSYSNDGESLLKALALPYADHPDYRPEWAAE